MIAQEILADLESQGARFWEENGALRYSAPKGLMDQNDDSNLRLLRNSCCHCYVEGAMAKET